MTIRFKPLLLAIVASCLANPILAAPVESMSLETFRDGPTRFWEVSVNCEASTEVRLMRRPVDSDKWCSSDEVNLCDKNKFSLSRQLCSDNFVGKVASEKNDKNEIDVLPPNGGSLTTTILETEASTRLSLVEATQLSATSSASNRLENHDNLLKEQMQIEEQRILIEQKRLELRRRELDLRKQQLNEN